MPVVYPPIVVEASSLQLSVAGIIADARAETEAMASDAAAAAAATAAADAVAAAQPGIAQAAQTAADTAAAAVAPAAADAIRAQVATDADRAEIATIATRASAEDARAGKSPAISGGTGAYLNTSEGPRVEQVARSRHAVETWAGDERVTRLDTTEMLYDLSGLGVAMREASVDPAGDVTLDQSDKPVVEVLAAERSAAKVIGSPTHSLLEFDTINNGLRPNLPPSSDLLPSGIMVMRSDGSLGLSGMDAPAFDPTATFKTGDWFPELRNSFFVTTDPAYADRVTNMAAAGAITMRPVPVTPEGIAHVPRLWATWYSRQHYDAGSLTAEGPGNYIVLAYSDDPLGATGTWHEALYVVPVDVTRNRLYDSFVHNLPNGQIMLTFAAKGGGTTYTDGRTGSYGVIIQNPDDPGGHLVWSDPIDLGVGIMSQMRITAQGGLYGSLDVWAGFDGNAALPWRGKWLSRLDFRHRYDQQPRLILEDKLPALATGLTYDETMIVQTLDGGWLAHYRVKDQGITQTRFDPATQTWSAPVALTQQPNTTRGTRNSLARSPSGRLVMAFNRGVTVRSQMSVALSDDDGVTWPYFYTFDPREDTSYPILSFDNAGRIHVVYDYKRGQNAAGVKDILWATIPEQSVIDGTPTHTLNFVAQ